jgi:hypothetical protein
MMKLFLVVGLVAALLYMFRAPIRDCLMGDSCDVSRASVASIPAESRPDDTINGNDPNVRVSGENWETYRTPRR